MCNLKIVGEDKMQKFKVGDRVKLICTDTQYVSKKGKVISVNFDAVNWPYRVILDNIQEDFPFAESELELIEKKDSVEVYNTTVDVKSKYFNKFSELIGSQFKHGGNKYSLPNDNTQEATDVISRYFGGDTQMDWVLGTMMKYVFRFKNFGREKDLLKVATYCYILWLKKGFHLREEHDEDVKK